MPTAVHADLVERLFKNAVSIGGMGAIFAIFGAYVAARTQDSVVEALVVGGVLASVAHVGVCRAYWRHPRPTGRDLMRRWEFRYAAPGCVSAALLGLATARVYADADLPSGMLMTGLLFGYGSGLMARNAVRLLSSTVRILLLVTPAVLMLESRFDLPFAALGLMLVFFTAAGIETMTSLYRQALSEITLRLDQSEKARQDPLTGLANRRGLDDFITAAGTLRAAPNQVRAAFCLDLDHFKAVNDRHGHAGGDALLQAVAARLRGITQQTDFVARLGGDEFVIVRTMAAEGCEVEAFAALIVDRLRASYRLGDIIVTAGASVGVAVGRGGDIDIGALLVKADAALYAAKSRGRNTFMLARGSAHGPSERPGAGASLAPGPVFPGAAAPSGRTDAGFAAGLDGFRAPVEIAG